MKVMISRFGHRAVLPIGLLLTACSTAPSLKSIVKERPVTLVDLENRRDVIQLPYERNDKNLILVTALINDQPVKMILDTGATRSVIFRHARKRLALGEIDQEKIQIHGMVSSELAPQSEKADFSFGGQKFSNFTFVVLKDRLNDDATPIYSVDGIIGLDVMSDIHFVVDASSKMISIMSRRIPPLLFPTEWDQIYLQSNPYISEDKGLKFLDLRIAGKVTPALLDTGAEFNVMNWKAAHFPQLRQMKRRMRHKWEVEGAVGHFSPMTKINVEYLRSGQKRWNDGEFIVMDLDSLKTIGSQDYPFLIAGIDLFKEESFYLNLKDNIMTIKRGKKVRRPPPLGPGFGVTLGYLPSGISDRDE